MQNQYDNLLKFIVLFVCIFSVHPLFSQNVKISQTVKTIEIPEENTFYSLEAALLNPVIVLKLDLKKQKLASISSDISKLSNLQWLDVSRNKLLELPIEIGALKNLEYFDASRNKIELLPKEIGELTGLKSLILHNNNIGKLPSQIGKLNNLEFLDLSDNELDKFPEEMENLALLKYLDLRNILISEGDQIKVRSLLPNAKVLLSPSCACKY